MSTCCLYLTNQSSSLKAVFFKRQIRTNNSSNQWFFWFIQSTNQTASPIPVNQSNDLIGLYQPIKLINQSNWFTHPFQPIKWFDRLKPTNQVSLTYWFFDFIQSNDFANFCWQIILLDWFKTNQSNNFTDFPDIKDLWDDDFIEIHVWRNKANNHRCNVFQIVHQNHVVKFG